VRLPRGQRQQGLERRALAGGVGAGGHGEHPRARCQQARQVLDIEPPLRIGLQGAQPRTTAPRRLLPRHQVGMVFQPADDDLVAGWMTAGWTPASTGHGPPG
jgi:hypothetical protein